MVDFYKLANRVIFDLAVKLKHLPVTSLLVIESVNFSFLSFLVCQLLETFFKRWIGSYKR